MSQIRPWLDTWLQATNRNAVIIALIAVNMAMNILANASFNLSAKSDLRGFLLWQIAGNLAGLITVLTLTALLRFIPLSVVFPVTTGLAIIGVQIAAAALFFHEQITVAQWLGTTLIVGGIFLVSKT